MGVQSEPRVLAEVGQGYHWGQICGYDLGQKQPSPNDNACLNHPVHGAADWPASDAIAAGGTAKENRAI